MSATTIAVAVTKDTVPAGWPPEVELVMNDLLRPARRYYRAQWLKIQEAFCFSATNGGHARSGQGQAANRLTRIQR
jgi:hypothetical protein